MIKLVNDSIDRDDILALTNWLTQEETPKLTKGDLTKQLEQEFAEYIGTKYSVFVNSGSSAIFLMLLSLLVEGTTNTLKNKKIVVPALSWATDLSSPMILGMEPIICDCNLTDLSCDLDHLEKIFKEQEPAALLLVSVLGLVPDMERIQQLCTKYDVLLLEDVCESMGSTYNQKKLGSFGKASVFSTYYGHHISTIEGGFICTDDRDLYNLMLMQRSHGWIRDIEPEYQDSMKQTYKLNDFDSLYTFIHPGMNLRSTDLQAFIGLRMLKKLPEYIGKRYNNFVYYLHSIKTNELRIATEQYVSNFAYPILNKNRESIIKQLQENNIEVRPLIAGNIAKHPMWKKEENLPNAEQVHKYGFYIPNHPELTDMEVSMISNILNNYE